MAPTIVVTFAQAKITVTNQATGRHLELGSLPSGNRSSANPRHDHGRKPVSQNSHIARCPPGREPGAATSACSA